MQISTGTAPDNYAVDIMNLQFETPINLRLVDKIEKIPTKTTVTGPVRYSINTTQYPRLDPMYGLSAQSNISSVLFQFLIPGGHVHSLS